MTESTRPLPPLIPLSHGGWEVNSFMSSTEYTIRGMGLKPPNHVIPVIVVPGIMGTNLRAKVNPRPMQKINERNEKVNPGEVVWRPPNGMQEGINAAIDWADVPPEERQRLFDGPALEVDSRGPIALLDSVEGYKLDETAMRKQGWGEVHADSYGVLLHALQTRLNQTFGFDEVKKERFLLQHWKNVMACDPHKWGVREFEPLTEKHLSKHAKRYFPVYAVGYNWLEDCGKSSERLESRIHEIIAFWQSAKRHCEQVILVTHSMGGLVARSCAKRIPDKIAGVIHGVMPAFGAPVAYRRMACGTESSSPDNSPFENAEALALAKILGETPQKATAVLASSPGALELLPNHLFPGPWLHVRVIAADEKAPHSNQQGNAGAVGHARDEYLHLPGVQVPNPYDLYRDFTSWYRAINPALADPAKKYQDSPGGVEKVIKAAIQTAENFHRSLDDYYHPNTYVFYGNDQRKRSYGQVRWTARQPTGSMLAVSTGNICAARFLGYGPAGERRVGVEGKTELLFDLEKQDVRGDGTVPFQSGAGPGRKVKQVFATRGYDHQKSFKDQDMLLLTLRLIAKIVQEPS